MIKKQSKTGARKKAISKSRVIFLLFCITLPIIQWLYFYVYGNFTSILMAFHNLDGQWSLDNFRRFFTELTLETSDIRIAFKNTFLTFGILLIAFPFKVLVSYFIYKKIAGYRFFRIVFFLPTVLVSVCTAMAFSRIVGTNGFIAQAVGEWLHLDYVPELLADSRFANIVVILEMLWLGFPGDLIIWGGTFARIPDDVLESGAIDGTTWWTEFTRIVVPMVWPTVSLQMVLLFCGIFGASGNVFLLTGGEFGTHTLSSWQYVELLNASGANYSSNVHNYLSAVGLMLTVVAVTISFTVRRITDKYFDDVEY